MTVIKDPIPPEPNNPREQKLKSLIIQISGKKTSYIEIIAQYYFNLTSPAELAVLSALYELYSNNTFTLNSAVKAQLQAKTGGTEGKLKVAVSRLLKSGALVKSGRLIGLNLAFKDVGLLEQVVLRVV